MTLEDLQRALRTFAAARDWQPWHHPKNLVMALSGEVGELISLFQWLTPEEARDYHSDPTLAANVRDELADVLLYLLQLADALDIDLLAAGAAKMARNETRFPPVDR